MRDKFSAKQERQNNLCIYKSQKQATIGFAGEEESHEKTSNYALATGTDQHYQHRA